MINQLPQKESDPKKLRHREDYLRRMQSCYEYSYDFADTIAVIRKLPWREIPGLRYWLLGGMNLLLLVPSLANLARTFVRYWLGRPLQSYRDYVFYPRSPQPNPSLVEDFQEDLMFGMQRVVGVNPVVLRAVSEQRPLPDKISAPAVQRIFSEQIGEIEFAQAIAQKRVYVLDYAVLEVLSQNPGHIDGGRRKHNTTPIVVLYQQADGMLRPIAIQLHQGDTENEKIYTAQDGNLWLAAKTFAQIADGNHHILYTHATRIHYVMEAVILAARRQLYKTHPLYVLLCPHLKFTLNVNTQRTFLKNRKGRPGRFGQLFAGDYDATTQCMANGMTSFDFRDSAFPDDILLREVDNPALFYPYRDDGILLWEAIQQFTGEYVGLYYDSDDEVAGDGEINAWANDIGAKNRGRISGFPNQFESRKVLAETLGHVIFLCTAHHSCIHFNQYQFPGFVPNMPYAAYAPPPAGNGTDIDAAALFEIQPALRAAYTQTWTYFLTNFRVNRIGQYNLRQFDPAAGEVIVRFKARLMEIEEEIEGRNRRRPVGYERMKPSSIPNSVSV